MRGVLAQGNEVWVCGAKSGGGGGALVRRSTDQGMTWQTWNLDGKFTTPYRMVRTPHALYACGYGGEIWRVGDLVSACSADCNADGALTVADFGCFQTKFVAGDPSADCSGDGSLTVADFGCFQTGFVAGCP
ncbi:MAG: GC-type dockerin domain-anchored protein [Phycisphaerales bacterium]